MNVPTLNIFEVVVVSVEAFAPYVPHVTECLVAYWNLNAVSGVAHWRTAAQTVSWLHAHNAHAAVAQLLSNFGKHGDVFAVRLDGELQRLVQLWQ